MESFQVGSSSIFSSCSNVIPFPGDECRLIAEITAKYIVTVVQPTVGSEQKRFEIITYIRELIRDLVGDEVMAFGSVPLKVYLPDGDIDLTVLTAQTDVKCLSMSIFNILVGQKYADPPIMDVQFVDAEVIIVKCCVDYVAVDISFNQVAGLNSLCLLEQIDQQIGRDHLFKRSIILTKAWCFYESRLLGSHCSLISTYALEILVLCIINLFHSSLSGPLAVFYKFLDYYSTFDWDKYCISVNGPVDINFLPQVTVETSATRGTNMLLSKDFLESCIKSFPFPVRGFETERQVFQKKHLNIIDPLKGWNNLGRSINKANFYRIKYAFSYGCQELRDILQLPVVRIGNGIMEFFSNTLGRSAEVQLLDAEVSAVDLKGDYDCPVECLNYTKWCFNSDLNILCQSNLPTFSPFESQSIEKQFTQNVWYLGSADPFVSSSFFHLNSSHLFYSVSSVDETAKYLGENNSIPSASSKGKSKLNASAPPFVSSAVAKKVKCEGTGLFIPKVDMDRMSKSKETDFWCPNQAQYFDRRANLLPMGGNSVKTYTNNQLVDLPSEPDKVAGSCCFDLSREEFLHLPSCNNDATEPDRDGKSSYFDLSLEDFPLLPSRKKDTKSET